MCVETTVYKCRYINFKFRKRAFCLCIFFTNILQALDSDVGDNQREARSPTRHVHARRVRVMNLESFRDAGGWNIAIVSAIEETIIATTIPSETFPDIEAITDCKSGFFCR